MATPAPLVSTLLLLHIVALVFCTAWYARRPSIQSTGNTLLVIFAWIVPILGLVCLLVFLVALPKHSVSEKQVSPISAILVVLSVAASIFLYVNWPQTRPDTVHPTSVNSCAALGDQEACPENDLMRPNPYFVDGRIQGFKVYPGTKIDEFWSTGLRPGDLITEFDGQPLIEIQLVSKLLAQLSDGRPVQVTVERKGASKVIELQAD